jgi:hypothetical protein
VKTARALAAVLLGTALCLAALGSAQAASTRMHAYRPGAVPSIAATGTSAGLPDGRRVPGSDGAQQTGFVIVHTKSAATESVLANVAKRVRANSSGVRHLRGGRTIWAVPSGRSASEFAKELVSSGQVEYAVPDYTRELADYTPPSYATPNDQFFQDSRPAYFTTETFPNFSESWWLREIRAPQAWAEAYTGPDVTGKYPLRADGAAKKVVVLDSGLYMSHEDAQANLIGGYDFADHQDSNYPYDWVQDNDVTPFDPYQAPSSVPLADWILDSSHGTCVAGEIGATANNGVGSVGVGYDTHVIVDKIMGFDISGVPRIDDAIAADALWYAVDVQHANVISMSWGGFPDSPDISAALQHARQNGVVLVAAKGNEGSAQAYYPASYSGVVAVGAVDKDLKGNSIPASFSNYYHTSRDIMAPGSYVWGLSEPGTQVSAYLGVPTGYAAWDGTSMSTPIVAGAIAWLWRAAPSLSGDEITNIVLNSATKHAATTHYPSGWRELDMYAAYKMLQAEYPLLVHPAVTSQKTASLSGNTRVFWNLPESPLRGVTFVPTVDGIAQSSTSASQADYALGVGTHTLSVQAHSSYNWDDGTAIGNGTVQVVASAPGTSTLSAHVAGSNSLLAAPAYGQSTLLDATLEDASGTALAGATVTLESSTNGVNFSAVGGGAASNVAPGVYRLPVTQTARTYYRFEFAGAAGVNATASNVVTVIPHLYVGAPSSKSSISHKKKLTVSGTVKPARSSKSRAVQLQIYRWNGHTYTSYSRVWATAKSYGSYSSYSASLKLKKGSYRVYAYAPGDATHYAATSGYKSVKVS